MLVSPASNNNCAQPQGGRSVRGSVASVNGDTITITGAGNTSQTTVTVTPATTYSKRAAADSQAIAQGMCLAARGTNDSSGTLQATTINLRPATNGTCPGARR